MDDLYARIVSIVLITSDFDRDERLSAFPSELVAAACLDAVLSVNTLSNVTAQLCDVVRLYRCDAATLERGVDVITGHDASNDVRAACLFALDASDGLEELLRDRIEARELARLREHYPAWRQTYEANREPPQPAPALAMPDVFDVSELKFADQLTTTRAIRERQAEWREFVKTVFASEDFDEVISKLEGQSETFVFDALVDAVLIDASPHEWEPLRNLVIFHGSSTPESSTRLRAAVCDVDLPADLRTEALLILGMGSATSLPPLRRHVDQSQIDDWDDLESKYRFRAALGMFHFFPLFSNAVQPMTLGEFDEVADTLAERGCEVEWHWMLDDVRLLHLWPRAAEEMMSTTDPRRLLHRLERRVSQVEDAEWVARMRRVIIKLRALSG